MTPAGHSPMLAATKHERLLLVGLVGLVSAPHLWPLPLWVGLGAAGPLLGQAFAQARRHRPPVFWLRAGLTGALFVAVFVVFGQIDGQISGQTAGVSLLMLMLPLKLCELIRARDAWVVLTLCCVVLASQFLFSQSLAMAAYLLGGLWAVIAVLVYLHTLAAPGRARPAMAEAGTLLGLAAPVAVALLVLFPRLAGPL